MTTDHAKYKAATEEYRLAIDAAEILYINTCNDALKVLRIAVGETYPI